MKINHLFSCFLTLVLFCACAGNREPMYVASPLDQIIKDYVDKRNFNVILTDMDYREKEDKYFHQYKILIREKNLSLSAAELQDSTATADDITIINTDWKEVSPLIFEDHKNDLGMTILSKVNGVLDKNTAPAGMNGYVGNSSYGQWNNSQNTSHSYWHFYARYRLMRALWGGNGGGGYGNNFNGFSRNEYTAYNTRYKGKKDFYGTSNQFTTGSLNNNSRWATKPLGVRNQVNTKVAQSAADLKAKGFTSDKNQAKTARNSSRYNSSSSSRTTSGGFGK